MNLGPAAFAVCAALLLTGCSKGPDKYELRESAIALYEAGDCSGAIGAFNEALEASDGQVSDLQFDILKYRGECEIRTGDYVAARSTYEALVELDKDSTDSGRSEELLSQLGALDKIKDAADIFRSGNYADAYDAFKPLAQLDGSLTGRAAVYDLALSAEYMGNYEEAYTVLREYTAMYPDDEAALKEMHFCETRR